MVEKRIAKIIENFAAALALENIHIDRIILYGSHATGNSTPDSDIDIAVVSRDFGRDTTEEGMLLFRIAGKIDSRLEPIPLSLDSYEKDTWVPLIFEIRSNGIDLKAA